MSSVDDLFQQLRQRGEKALMPFVTAGDPDLAFTGEVLQRLDQHHCHLFEIGIPYSDPIADGPVIQASYTRALSAGTKLPQIWKMLGELRPSIRAPRVAMASYAIIHRVGLERFVDDAQQAGLAGVIVPDLLVEESAHIADLYRRRDFNLIQLVTPTTPRDRALRIAESTSGFLYYVSVTGITGERNELAPELAENVEWLRERTPLPICIGFGISQAEHVRQLAPVADGLIVGSAFVRRVAKGSEAAARPEVLDEVAAFADSLLEALPKPAGEPA
jgi:tryptophan synthase alpha chain